MTSEAKPRIKVTYATLRADNEDLHTGFEEAATKVRGELGAYHQNFVDGVWRDGVGTFEARSPIDPDLVLGDVRQRLALRHRRRRRRGPTRQPAWAATPWRSGWPSCAAPRS